jgi:hypothetical protein
MTPCLNRTGLVTAGCQRWTETDQDLRLEGQLKQIFAFDAIEKLEFAVNCPIRRLPGRQQQNASALAARSVGRFTQVASHNVFPCSFASPSHR